MPSVKCYSSLELWSAAVRLYWWYLDFDRDEVKTLAYEKTV
ncbi:MAG TPA: hypothetical protein VE890_18170 [Thermoguttaceae bacterium]|nr:hypothetical protein [Thermoguttaceae bacterium]